MAVEKLVIIGSGPAGLAAAIYAARAALNPLCFEGYNAGGLIPGGQLMFTTDVENYPGFPQGILGPEMMKAFRDQAQRFGTRFITEDVAEITPIGNVKDETWLRRALKRTTHGPFLVRSEEHTVLAHALIIATGARANWLGLPNEKRLAESGGGVSACAVCDGALPIFRDQDLAVVGGGDSAVEEASYLAKFARHVHLIHRRDQLRASKAMQERFFRLVQLGRMTPVWDTVVTDVLGDTAVTGLRLKNVKTGQERDLAARGLFLAIGHTPNSDLVRGLLKLDGTGYIRLANPAGQYGTATDVEGLFAAGDVADHVYRQAVTAAGSGCMAALDAERWLANQQIE
jgi:thioredoxin reductase (NADPH)